MMCEATVQQLLFCARPKRWFKAQDNEETKTGASDGEREVRFMNCSDWTFAGGRPVETGTVNKVKLGLFDEDVISLNMVKLNTYGLIKIIK